MLPKLQFLILLLVLSACSKQNVFQYDKLEAYDDLVQSVARYTASIETRHINWDSLANNHRQSITNELSEAAYFELVSQLLLTLRDPHVWLLAPHREMYTIEHLNYTKNVDRALLKKYYLSSMVHHSTSISSATIQDSIAYLSCLDFKGDIEQTNRIYQEVFQQLASKKGLIIDLRENDGGNVYNAQNLLNKMIGKRQLWHTTQNRTPQGFDTPYKWYIEPDTSFLYNGKIAVLIGRYTISAGERFAIGAKLSENIVLIGDTTANTQGAVMGREMLNGWQYTLTFEKVLDANGINYDGIGIAPTIYLSSDSAVIGQQDKVLEHAMDWIEQ